MCQASSADGSGFDVTFHAVPVMRRPLLSLVNISLACGGEEACSVSITRKQASALQLQESCVLFSRCGQGRHLRLKLPILEWGRCLR